MLLGALTGLVVAGVNVPLSNVLGRSLGSPVKFLVVYFLLGLLVVAAGTFICMQFLPLSAVQGFASLGLFIHLYVGWTKYRELKGAQGKGL